MEGIAAEGKETQEAHARPTPIHPWLLQCLGGPLPRHLKGAVGWKQARMGAARPESSPEQAAGLVEAGHASSSGTAPQAGSSDGPGSLPGWALSSCKQQAWLLQARLQEATGAAGRGPGTRGYIEDESSTVGDECFGRL